MNLFFWRLPAHLQTEVDKALERHAPYLQIERRGLGWMVRIKDRSGEHAERLFDEGLPKLDDAADQVQECVLMEWPVNHGQLANILAGLAVADMLRLLAMKNRAS